MKLRTEGQLQQLRGKLRSTWGKLTDDDIDQAGGNFDTLVGKIKEKTGESEQQIRSKLRDIQGQNEQGQNETKQQQDYERRHS